MAIASRTPGGWQKHCPVCGYSIRIEPSIPSGDAPCPRCGSLLWFDEFNFQATIDWMKSEATISDLIADNAPDAIREITARLTLAGLIPGEHEEELVRTIQHRESLGSTGIGSGFALPHASHLSLSDPVGALAFSRRGIGFQSIDGEPVHVVILYVVPTNKPDEDTKVLRQISQYLRVSGDGTAF